MSNLTPINQGSGGAPGADSGPGLPSLFSRREEKALQRHMSRTMNSLAVQKEVGIARIETQAQIEAAKVHAVGYVGSQALHAVAMLSQLEVQLAQTVPAATTRLQGLADMTALALADVVASSARKLG